MITLHLLVVALVQGITEFLPISSSAHLVLIPIATGWPDQGIAIDIAAHVGSLGAVFVYFRRDIAALAAAALAVLGGRVHPAGRLLAWLIVSTIPALVAGFALADAAGTAFRDIAVIAWTMTLGAVLLYLADRYGGVARPLDDMRARDALWIGLAQVLALVPGTSRAGITMTMARVLGITRADAARFSMLLSIPVIAGAGTMDGLALVARGDAPLIGDALIAAALSFVAALAAIAVLMRWLERSSFTPLVVYRLALGLVLLAIVYL
ncbi:MAG TPA: undecaprenyl-diphosphate phosphatase [Alphaproteobacteria bacterium]